MIKVEPRSITKHLLKNNMNDKSNSIISQALSKIKALQQNLVWGDIQSAKKSLLTLETLLEALEKEMVK